MEKEKEYGLVCILQPLDTESKRLKHFEAARDRFVVNANCAIYAAPIFKRTTTPLEFNNSDDPLFKNCRRIIKMCESVYALNYDGIDDSMYSIIAYAKSIGKSTMYEEKINLHDTSKYNIDKICKDRYLNANLIDRGFMRNTIIHEVEKIVNSVNDIYKLDITPTRNYSSNLTYSLDCNTVSDFNGITLKYRLSDIKKDCFNRFLVNINEGAIGPINNDESDLIAVNLINSYYYYKVVSEKYKDCPFIYIKTPSHDTINTLFGLEILDIYKSVIPVKTLRQEIIDEVVSKFKQNYPMNIGSLAETQLLSITIRYNYNISMREYVKIMEDVGFKCDMILEKHYFADLIYIKIIATQSEVQRLIHWHG